MKKQKKNTVNKDAIDVVKTNNTRTANVVRNVWVGVVCQLFVLILSFVNRTIFIKMLSFI